MGDRVSISFAQKRSEADRKMFGGPSVDESVVLFHQWGGEDLPRMAVRYLAELKEEGYGNEESVKELKLRGPLGRLEPSTVMVDFIRWYLKHHHGRQEATGRVTGDLYLGTDWKDGDNSDNGHYVIDVDECRVREVIK